MDENLREFDSAGGPRVGGGISALVMRERMRAVRVTLRANMVMVCVEAGNQVIFAESNSNVSLRKPLLYISAQFLYPYPV